MDYLWAGMLLIGICYGAFNGNILAVSNAVLSAAGEAISLCITTAGVLTLWTGVMEIAKNAGIIQTASKLIRPFISYLFPKIPENHPAISHISLNFIANFLGLNWGATPAGLKAMEELKRLSPNKVASDEMCMFIVINTASIQIIPSTVIALRQGAATPTDIIIPVWICSICVVTIGVLAVKIFSKRQRC
jgi:spore maturation protein A